MLTRCPECGYHPEECECENAPRVERRLRMIGTAAFTCGEVDRSYGGPEEGGWYYDDFRPIRVIVVPARKAERCARLLKRWEDRQNEGRPQIHSVLSYGRAQVREGIEEATQRPHYE